jgi:hypothetical protein
MIVIDEGGLYRAVDTSRAHKSKVPANMLSLRYKSDKNAFVDFGYVAHYFYTQHVYGVGNRKSLLN